MTNIPIKDEILLKAYLDSKNAGVLGDFLKTASTKTGETRDYLNQRGKFLNALNEV